MLQQFCSYLLYKVWGWKTEVTIPRGDKYVIALAPHTSNVDFLLGLLYSRAEGFTCDFLMKKEWFFWPLGYVMRALGGIPVYRSKHTSMTDRLAEIAKQRTSFHLCITPEGTRSRTEEWKKGFYYIAQKAQLPILLYGLDFKTKTIRCTHQIIPNGHIEEQMKEIKLYFKDYTGKYPEKFTVGKI